MIWEVWFLVLGFVFLCFGAARRAPANGCFSPPDPVPERRAGGRDSAPAPEKPTSPGRTPEKRAKDDSRRVVKSAQDLSDVSMDEVGIPLRVRLSTDKSLLVLLVSPCMHVAPAGSQRSSPLPAVPARCGGQSRRALCSSLRAPLVLGSVCSRFPREVPPSVRRKGFRG